MFRKEKEAQASMTTSVPIECRGSFSVSLPPPLGSASSMAPSVSLMFTGDSSMFVLSVWGPFGGPLKRQRQRNAAPFFFGFLGVFFLFVLFARMNDAKNWAHTTSFHW